MFDSETPLDLVDLMRRYQEGDTAAFTKLYPAVRRRVQAELRSMRLPPALVDDISQQALMRAHAARGTFRIEGTTRSGVLAWFGSIAKRVAIDTLRGGTRRLARVNRAASQGTTFMANSDEFCQTPEDLKIRDEERRAAASVVHEALRHLAPTQREAVELHKLRGMTVQDAAAQTGSRPVTLRVRAHRGYKALAKHICSNAPEFARPHLPLGAPGLAAA